ncbi:hypothetical protein FOQG_13183 [Fusarium oxysporum f. sp. raphani 54005]|uniref:DUF6536 domain-containing protein n=1 Tax=Fusarium oxysporum f. sp. raphani 54005 TaxID=1089458 RepID=X0BJX7_FUSOX|nr:hypothetical protein FOQG_13183 [Fusarium oxysporum f. sp. raphani 54005]
MKKLSGWRKTALYLTILATILTIFLVTALVISLHVVNGGGASIFGETAILSGSCDKTSNANLWIHLAINVIGTGVLGSSNFFMQVLVAPTRKDVDCAHASKRWVEIGVPSIHNFRFISKRRILLWALFSLTGIPLHLVFNGSILESKATNGFVAIMASETFLDGARFTLPSVTTSSSYPSTLDNESPPNKTIRSIKSSLGEESWERLGFQDCMRRYNDLEVLMLDHRHVVMVMSNQNNMPSSRWTRSNVVKGGNGWDDQDAPNSLWFAGAYYRFRDSRGLITNSTNNNTVPGYYMQLDPDTGVIYMNETKYEPAFQTMKVDYCLSERFHAPCRLSIANPLLLIVCIMCLSKCLLCAYTLKVRSWRSEEPLMTVGDAISSFIAKPDTCTKGMCTLDAEDLHMKPDPERALSSPRPWKKKQVVAGNAVNPGVWILSYMLIGSLLVLGGLLLAPALQTQSLRESRFAHHHKNADVNDSGLKSASLLGLTMISNTPQLLLSLCYMTLNGLITRMLAEFEWASYGIQFKALRVTSPRGIQRSTYRLQLPYRWSIPLLAISSILHWVYSNCFYLSNYEFYDPMIPYEILEVDRGLQFSSVAILIGFSISVVIALSPMILAKRHLPGQMVLGGSNSKVISAACHCIPVSSSHATRKAGVVTVHPLEISENLGDPLHLMASMKLRWGDVSTTNAESEVGHLAFGVEEQGVTEPIEQKHYSRRACDS